MHRTIIELIICWTGQKSI